MPGAYFCRSFWYDSWLSILRAFLPIRARQTMSSDATPVSPQPQKSNSSTVLIIVIVVVGGFFFFIACTGVLVALLLPAIQAAREAARRATCTNNTKQVALALLNYEDRYGSFPPAYVADENGKPMHSWRVLILPYLEANDVYQAYDFDEPWDGPNNRKLAGRMPGVFRCPSSPESGNDTNYVAVVGDETVWPGATGVARGQIKDGASNTILVVETSDSGINWMEPRDLTLDEAVKGVNPPAGPGISSHHPGGAVVGFCDGHVQFVDEDARPDALRALLTKDGKEDVNASALDH
jgi:prepilin-type processing-associated H-X9-DG protein